MEDGGSLLGVHWPAARLKNFTFRNIQLLGKPGKGLVRAGVDGLTFESVMLFLNHSCEPNVGIQGQIVVVAERNAVLPLAGWRVQKTELNLPRSTARIRVIAGLRQGVTPSA